MVYNTGNKAQEGISWMDGVGGDREVYIHFENPRMTC